MRIAFIGAGNVATHIAMALKENGEEIVGICSRGGVSAAALAAKTGARHTSRIEEMPDNADVYIISANDDSVDDIASRLCPGRTCSVFVHTAGSVPASVFEGKARHYGVMYPMQSFSRGRQLNLRLVPCYTEASDETAQAVISHMASEIFGPVRSLASNERRYLHLAAVFACNFTNFCYDMTEKIAARHGIPFSDFLPLIAETADKVRTMTPHDAQTGPAIRYDNGVMARQTELLDSDKLLQDIYKLMSEAIHNEHRFG